MGRFSFRPGSIQNPGNNDNSLKIIKTSEGNELFRDDLLNATNISEEDKLNYAGVMVYDDYKIPLSKTKNMFITCADLQIFLDELLTIKNEVIYSDKAEINNAAKICEDYDYIENTIFGKYFYDFNTKEFIYDDKEHSIDSLENFMCKLRNDAVYDAHRLSYIKSVYEYNNYNFNILKRKISSLTSDEDQYSSKIERVKQDYEETNSKINYISNEIKNKVNSITNIASQYINRIEDYIDRLPDYIKDYDGSGFELEINGMTLTISPTSIYLKEDGVTTGTAKLYINPDIYANNDTIELKCTNDSIIDFSMTGSGAIRDITVTYKSEGSCNIYAVGKDPTGNVTSNYCNVVCEVKDDLPVPELILSPTSIATDKFNQEFGAMLSIKNWSSEFSNVDLTSSTSDSAVATLGSFGKADSATKSAKINTKSKFGSTTVKVTGTFNLGKETKQVTSNTCNVTVSRTPVTLTLAPENTTFNTKGATKNITVTITNKEYADINSLDLKSYNKNVCTFEKSGGNYVVTSIANGEATLQATIKDIYGNLIWSNPIYVKVAIPEPPKVINVYEYGFIRWLSSNNKTYPGTDGVWRNYSANPKQPNAWMTAKPQCVSPCNCGMKKWFLYTPTFVAEGFIDPAKKTSGDGIHIANNENDPYFGNFKDKVRTAEWKTMNESNWGCNFGGTKSGSTLQIPDLSGRTFSSRTKIPQKTRNDYVPSADSVSSVTYGQTAPNVTINGNYIGVGNTATTEKSKSRNVELAHNVVIKDKKTQNVPICSGNSHTVNNYGKFVRLTFYISVLSS